MKINKKIIEELVRYLKEFNLSEIEYSEGSTKVKVARSLNNLTNISSVISSEATSKKPIIDSSLKVTSPIVGTAYLAPEPGSKKFIEEGQKIKKGQTIMIVEAMKTMNHVPSPKDGVVKSINVEDGQPVEYGQTLVVID